LTILLISKQIDTLTVEKLIRTSTLMITVLNSRIVFGSASQQTDMPFCVRQPARPSFLILAHHPLDALRPMSPDVLIATSRDSRRMSLPMPFSIWFGDFP